ncbi:hypothetical protein D3C86_1559520 [compost metagenome]
MLGALLQQPVSHEEQSADSGQRLVGQRVIFFTEVDEVRRAFPANHQQIAAQPGLELTSAGALLDVSREECVMPWCNFLQVFGNGRRFRQGKTFVNQGGNLAGQRYITITRLIVITRL